MKDNGRAEKLLDKIYENKSLLLRYFIWVILCSVLRYVITIVLSGILSMSASDAELISWVIWSPVFYLTLKYFVFKTRSEHIYALFSQLIIFILCIFVLWIIRGVMTGFLYMLSQNAAVAAAIGGVITEVVCLALMTKAVFR